MRRSFPRGFYLSTTDKANAVDASSDSYNMLGVTPLARREP